MPFGQNSVASSAQRSNPECEAKQNTENESLVGRPETDLAQSPTTGLIKMSSSWELSELIHKFIPTCTTRWDRYRVGTIHKFFILFSTLHHTPKANRAFKQAVKCRICITSFKLWCLPSKHRRSGNSHHDRRRRTTASPL